MVDGRNWVSLLCLTPLVELAGLGGQERLEGYEVFSLIRYE